MCAVDHSDLCEVLSSVKLTARKDHRCSECGRVIGKSEKYLRECTLLDGSKDTIKTCEHCQVVRSWLSGECGGWVYEGVEEDIMEHAQEGYGIGVIRLAVGMRRFWTTRKGQLMKVPTLPKTTHELERERKANLPRERSIEDSHYS